MAHVNNLRPQDTNTLAGQLLSLLSYFKWVAWWIKALHSRAYSRKLGECTILARNDNFFMKKGHQNPPYSIPFLHVLHQNKVLYNFCKRGQPSIVKHNIGLEYALYSESEHNLVQTSLGSWPDFGTQPHYKATGDLGIKISIKNRVQLIFLKYRCQNLSFCKLMLGE